MSNLIALRTGARRAEEKGLVVCAGQMRAAADEIERLRVTIAELDAALAAADQKYEDYFYAKEAQS